jgi:hypothetical protein
MHDLRTLVESAALETLPAFNAVLKELFPESFIIWLKLSGAIVIREKERDGGMLLQMREGSRIENPREYSAHTVEDLRRLLATGSGARRDPRRENFYQLENHTSTYYIHVSPITGNVMLLAKWSRQPQGCYADEGSLVA